MLQLWDIQESENFKLITPSYCVGAEGALLMYDITNLKSLNFLIDFIQVIMENAGDIPILLVGNNLEIQEFREVSKEQGTQIAEEYNLSGFVEISTKTGQNITIMFKTFTEMLMQRFCAH